MAEKNSEVEYGSKFIKLNIGGHLFITSLETLTKFNTMFRPMFNGNMKVTTDPDGYVVIDRDGKHFGKILNCLRDGEVALPNCPEEISEILAEAKFYCFQELILLCQNALKPQKFLEFKSKEEFEKNYLSDEEYLKLKDNSSKPIVSLFLLQREERKLIMDENIDKNKNLFEDFELLYGDVIHFVKRPAYYNYSNNFLYWDFYFKKRNFNRTVSSIFSIIDGDGAKGVAFPKEEICINMKNLLELIK